MVATWLLLQAYICKVRHEVRHEVHHEVQHEVQLPPDSSCRSWQKQSLPCVISQSCQVAALRLVRIRNRIPDPFPYFSVPVAREAEAVELFQFPSESDGHVAFSEVVR